MKIKKIALVSLMSLVLSACNGGTPKCDSNDAKNLVIKISTDELHEQSPGLEKMITLSVDDVITRSHNKNSDQYSCSANLYMTGPGGTKNLPITYTVAKTDNGEKILISVHGLR